MPGHTSPEEAVVADDPIPPEYVNVVAVEYSPDGDRAVVLVEYNEPPSVEPDVVLCERANDGWVAGRGSAGGGSTWMSTTDDGAVGVEVLWGPSEYRV